MNKMIVAIPFALMIGPSFAADQNGEVIQCPQHKTGDWYRFKTTDGLSKVRYGRITITGVNGDRLEAVNHRDRVEVYDRMFNTIKLGTREFTPKYYSRIECPFRLGETRKYEGVKYTGSTTGADITSNFKVTVDPTFTTVTTPVGEFKVIRIVSEETYQWEGSGASGGSGYGSTISYYSQDLGRSVKVEGTDNSGGPTTSYVSELVKYKKGAQ